MTNSKELEAAIAKAKITKKSIAKALEISEMSLLRKINNKTEFKASEIATLKSLLKLNDFERDKIFFAIAGD